MRRARTLLPPAYDGSCEGKLGASLAALVWPSAHAGLVYELKPSLDTCFFRARVTTSADGLRAASHQPLGRKRAGVGRILLLGDSQAFGWGVPFEDTVAEHLERELSAPGREVEVLNAGVPGYNAAQEAAYLDAPGARFEPDCAVVLFMGNDFDPPLFRAGGAPLPRPTSYVTAAVRRAVRRWRLPTAAEGQPLEALAFGPSVSFLDGDLADVPPEYRDMVGLPGYRRALASLARSGKRMGIPVVNFADYSYLLPPEKAEELRREQRALGVVHPDFEFPRGPALRLSDDDPHLSADGHRELARRMAGGLRASGACAPR